GRVTAKRQPHRGCANRRKGWIAFLPPEPITALQSGFTVPLRDRGGFGGRARRLARIHQCRRFLGRLRERPGPCLWRRRAEWRGGYLQRSAEEAPRVDLVSATGA